MILYFKKKSYGVPEFELDILQGTQSGLSSYVLYYVIEMTASCDAGAFKKLDAACITCLTVNIAFD